MIKVLSETKPEIPKPKTSKPEIPKIPKPKTPKTSKPETPKTPKLKPEIRVNKKKLKKLRQDFDELRHKFSKKEIGRYKKAFYVANNKKHLSKSEIKNTNKRFNKLKKVWDLKNFVVLTALIMKTWIVMIIIMILMMMMNIGKFGVLEHYLSN